MKKLKGISVRMIPPETISVNEPTRIDIVTDTTRFRECIKKNESILGKLRSTEEILSTIATKIKHRIIIETTKRIKSNVFENGKRFEKIMETLSMETKIRVPVGAVATKLAVRSQFKVPSLNVNSASKLPISGSALLKSVSQITVVPPSKGQFEHVRSVGELESSVLLNLLSPHFV